MKDIRAIILAAGESSRMKTAKMILPFGKSTIIETVITNVADSDAGRMVVVLGAWKKEIMDVIKKHNVNTCFNESYKNGMLSSVQCGLRFIGEESEAVLICPGDQPGADKDLINLIISAFKSSGKGIVIPSFEKKRGHPLLISSKYYNEIFNLNPEETLRKIIENHPDDIQEVETVFPSVLKDIDTPDDYINELKLIS